MAKSWQAQTEPELDRYGEPCCDGTGCLFCLQSARSWVADCLSYPDASVIDDARVRRYVDAHYPGRWDAFQRHMRMGTQYPVIPQ